MSGASHADVQSIEDRLHFQATILANVWDGIQVTDLEGRLTYWNQGAAAIFGYSADEVLGKTTAFLFPEQDPATLAIDLKNIREGVDHMGEWRGRHKDGSTVWIDVKVTVLRDGGGQVIGVIGVSRDITMRKRAEEAASGSSQFARSMLDALTAHIAILNEHGVILSINEAWRQFWQGEAPSNASWGIGANYFDVLDHATGESSAGAADTASAIRSMLRGEREAYYFEYPSHSPQELRWFAVRATRFAGQGPVRLVIAYENITQRKQAQERVRRNESLLAESQELAHIGSWNWDFGTGRLTWSDEHYRIWGLRPQEVPMTISLGMSFIHPDDLPPLQESIDRALRDRRPYECSVRVRRADGTVRVAHSRGQAVFDEAGKPVRMFGTIQDITERARAEEQLRTSEARLAEAERIAHLGSWQWSVAGGRLWWSDELYRICGLEPGEQQPDDDLFWARLHPEDRDRVEQAIERSCRHGQPYDLDMRLVRADGTVRTIHSIGDVVRDAAGKAVEMRGTAQDVTEERRSQEAEAQSHALLRAVIDGSTDAIYAKDLQGHYLMVNSTVSRLFDRPAQDIIGKADTELLPPETARRFRELDAIVIASGTQAFDVQTDLKGGVNWWHTLKSPLRDNRGRIVGVLGISRDLTDRQREAEALQHSEEKYRRIVETASEGIWQVNSRAQTVFVNRRTADMLGYTVEEMLGRDVREFCFPEDVDGALEHVARTFTESYRQLDFRLRRKDGSELLVLLCNSPLTDFAGIVTGGLNLLTDITQRKSDEEARARLSAIVESSGDAIISKSLDGTILSWNASAERIFGYAANEVIGRSITLLVPPERPGEETEILARLRDGERVEHFETVRVRRDGGRIDVAMTISPIRDTVGRVIGASNITRDISERKRVEERLLRSQKMETVGRLARGVAHDFNNLLATIASYDEALRRRLDAASPLVPYVDEIQHAAQRGSALVRRLLAFSRREAVSPEVLNFDALLVGLAEVLSRTIGSGIQLLIDADALACRVLADPGQIEQVLMNLALNARDAMSPGGTLSISTSRIALDQDSAASRGVPRGDYVLLTIADTGVGMDEQTRARIFEPFFTTKDDRGTGLGLSIVYEIVVEQFHGNISVRSEPGKGTTFEVLLPVFDPSKSQANHRNA